MWAVGYRFRKMIVFNQLGYGKQLEIWKSGYKQIMILKGLESFYLCRFWFSNFENHSVSIYFDSQILRIILKVYILILKFWESFGRYTVWFPALTLTHTHSHTHSFTHTLSHTHSLTHSLSQTHSLTHTLTHTLSHTHTLRKIYPTSYSRRFVQLWESKCIPTEWVSSLRISIYLIHQFL